MAENVALVTLLTGLMVLAVGQIVLREFFSTGFVWADELVKLIVLWLAMFGAIAAARENRHIRIDLLSHTLPPKAIVATRIVVDLFAAAVSGLIAFHTWRYMQLEIEFEEVVLIDTPAWIAHAILPLAFGLISYRFVVSVLGSIATLVLGKEADK